MPKRLSGNFIATFADTATSFRISWWWFVEHTSYPIVLHFQHLLFGFLFFFHIQIWSVIFRSWTSIVFLLVVSVLWTRPIQQKFVRRINFCIVFYADVLIILHYFHCITNTSREPSIIYFREIYANLFPIDIVQFDAFACIPLLFQTICVFTFCFTLRQEQKNKHRPTHHLQNRFSSASDHTTSDESKTIWKYFSFGVNVLSHIWVTMILLTMFTYAIYGNEVNVLKILYMLYVLVFVTTFQLSVRIWRKISYSFWMFVIASSMINLILIYTYQFDGVEHFWIYFMGFDRNMQVASSISICFHTFKVKKLQSVPCNPCRQTLLGLRHYKTKELLIQSSYFTFLVGITAVHVSVFHKRYIKQFIWKRFESRVNLNEPNGNEENLNESEEAENSSTPEQNVKKSYLERVRLAIVLNFWLILLTTHSVPLNFHRLSMQLACSSP